MDAKFIKRRFTFDVTTKPMGDEKEQTTTHVVEIHQVVGGRELKDWTEERVIEAARQKWADAKSIKFKGTRDVTIPISIDVPDDPKPSAPTTFDESTGDLAIREVKP
jgi:hypothetical protein